MPRRWCGAESSIPSLNQSVGREGLELVIRNRIKLQESIKLSVVVAVIHAHRVSQADESMMGEATQAAHWDDGVS
jgi:hypothetical protein